MEILLLTKHFTASLGMYVCFPPTFNGLLDFSIFPLDLVHYFVLFFLLFSLIVSDLLLLSFVSVSIFCLVLVGVFCGGSEADCKSLQNKEIITQTVSPTRAFLLKLLITHYVNSRYMHPS